MPNKDTCKPLAISLGLTLVICSVCPTAASASDNGAGAELGPYAAYYGNYRDAAAHAMGIDRFINDSGDTVILISDYTSGVVRRLFPVSKTDFVMGPGFDVQSPTELQVKFIKGPKGNVSGMALHPTNGAENFAKRVPLTERAISFSDGPVRLAGTLLLPAAKGPHPAIILLHGSGPLTRYSFGPYPHFFTSLGFAVLIYDKRGTGASTGTRVDASTGALAPLPLAYYPDDLANDALAALHFLQGQEGIDPGRIGLWGSSEGGMLTTQVAARSKDVAFIINSSGFMGSLWKTILYQDERFLRVSGASQTDVDRAMAFTKLWMDVARTGKDYRAFIAQRKVLVEEKKPWLFWFSGEFTSLEQMRWDWSHILFFSPLPELKGVKCPVLGVWGEKDESTDAAEAAENMRTVLSEAGNTDFTLKIFPNANHPLMEMPAGNRMAPGVFETLRSWLHMRVQTD